MGGDNRSFYPTDSSLTIVPYSGSQTMAYVMALQQGWPTGDLKFQGSEARFTNYSFKTNGYQWTTTYVDSSTPWMTILPVHSCGSGLQLNRLSMPEKCALWVPNPAEVCQNWNYVQIGSVPTPWPSWLIAAHPERTSPEAVTAFLTKLSTFARAFDSEESRVQKNVDFIKENFGYPGEDIEVGAVLWFASLWSELCHRLG